MEITNELMDQAAKGKQPIHIVPAKNKDLLASLIQAITNLFLFLFDGLLIYLRMPEYYQLISADDTIRLIYYLMDAETRLLFRSYEIKDCFDRMKNFPELQVRINDECAKNREYLNLANGVFDIRTMKKVPDMSLMFFDYRYELRYIPDSTLDQAPAMNAFLLSSLGESNIECFRRMLAYSLSSLVKGRVCFLLIGKGKTGKSTLLNLIERMIPEGTVSHEPFHRMASEQSKAKYRNKRLNISRDNSGTPMKHEESFKSLISAEMTTSRDVYEKSVDFVPTLKFLFASNQELAFAHPDDAVYDRIVPLVFSREIPEDQRDLDLEDKLYAERDIVFSWAVDSLKPLIESNYDFCMSEESREYLSHRRMNLHTVPDFLAELVEVDPAGEVASSKLFKAYEDWCSRNGLNAIGRNKFYGEVAGCIPSVKRTKVQMAGQQLQGFKGIKMRSAYTSTIITTEEE